MNTSVNSKTARAVIAAGFMAACVFVAAGKVSAQERGEDASFFGAADSTEDSSGSAPSLAFNGELRFSARAYANDAALDALNDAADAADSIEAVPLLKLDLSYKAASSEFFATVKLDQSTIADHPEDVLEEAYLRSYLGDFILETGKMKIVWGKGDKLHVLDLFNANDYGDFIFPDYIERRLAEPMVRLAWNAPSGLRAEAVWTPFMTADRVPSEGTWRPAQAAKTASLAESYVAYLSVQTYAAAYSSTNSQALASAAVAKLLSEYADGSALLPDTEQLDFGQYGLRLTGTAASVDWGASYYLGRFKTPSVAADYSGTQIVGLKTAYDRLQSFGLDAAVAIGPLNLRAETAYYLTEDTAGDDGDVRNNSVNWLFGFDIGLPIHNLNVNVQTMGSYLLGSDGIDSASDVEYDDDDFHTNNKIVAQISDNWLREKLVGEVKALWGIERGDLIFMPKLQWNVLDDLFLSVSGALFAGSDGGEFGAFTDNDFVRMTASYQF